MVYVLLHSAIGWLGVVGHRKRIAALLYGKSRVTLYHTLRHHFPSARQGRTGSLRKSQFYLMNYFKGKPVAAPLLDLSSQTLFQRKVLREVSGIPYGHTCTYRWLAQRIRIPGGARACGQVLHQNPLPIFIPCHRVVPTLEGLGGFIWGKGIKEKLLQHETKNNPRA